MAVSLSAEDSPPVPATVETDAATGRSLAERFAEEGLPALLGHRSAVDAGQRVETVYENFRSHAHEFMAVLEGGRFLGLCARREIGMLLGARYGFALFARKPVRGHLQRRTLRVTVGTPIGEVFAAAFSRAHESYYDDVPLLDESGGFLGLIFTDTLVRLQHEFLERNIRELEESQREIREKNQQIEEDLRLARDLQVALLPQQYPALPPGASAAESALHFCHHYLTSGTVGGDFFHVQVLNDDVASIFLCDVMGHGVRAALVTTMLRALVEELKADALEPAVLLGHLNRELLQILRQSGGTMFATAIALLVDVAAAETRFAVAGHPSPVLLRRSTGDWAPLNAREWRVGPALGLLPEARYETRTLSLAAGDAIVLYTDGLFEVDDAAGEEFGRARLMATIGGFMDRRAERLLDAVLATVTDYSATGEFSDDVCALVVEIQRLAPSATRGL